MSGKELSSLPSSPLSCRMASRLACKLGCHPSYPLSFLPFSLLFFPLFFLPLVGPLALGDQLVLEDRLALEHRLEVGVEEVQQLGVVEEEGEELPLGVGEVEEEGQQREVVEPLEVGQRGHRHSHQVVGLLRVVVEDLEVVDQQLGEEDQEVELLQQVVLLQPREPQEWTWHSLHSLGQPTNAFDLGLRLAQQDHLL